MSTSAGSRAAPNVPTFLAPYAAPDEQIAARLLAAAERPEAGEARIDARARRLVESIRDHAGGLGGIEDFLHAYSLSTKEGLALMVLAEALLRVPDTVTADRLIEDKLAAGDWSQAEGSGAFLVSASAWTLGVTARVIQPGETPETIVGSLVKRLGLPAVRTATRQAMRLLGSHFVLGQTIEEALSRAGSHREFRYSFDMLGEGARNAAAPIAATTTARCSALCSASSARSPLSPRPTAIAIDLTTARVITVAGLTTRHRGLTGTRVRTIIAGKHRPSRGCSGTDLTWRRLTAAPFSLRCS